MQCLVLQKPTGSRKKVTPSDIGIRLLFSAASYPRRILRCWEKTQDSI